MNDNTDSSDDTAYYLLRAKQEDDAANQAASARAAAIHRTLASRYRARVKDSNREAINGLSVVRD